MHDVATFVKRDIEGQKTHIPRTFLDGHLPFMGACIPQLFSYPDQDNDGGVLLFNFHYGRLLCR